MLINLVKWKRRLLLIFQNISSYNVADNSLVIIISISDRDSKIHKRVKFIKKSKKSKNLFCYICERIIYSYCDYEYSLSFLDSEYLNEIELPRHSKILRDLSII